MIQSSSAPTVMTDGFGNAGLLTLKQALWVVLGANVGTTFTAWLVSGLAVFKITTYALPAVGIGFLMQTLGRTQKIRSAGQVLLGFGILFATYHFTGQIPEPGEYVEVTAIGAKVYEPVGRERANRVKPAEEVAAGERLEYEGEATKRVAKDQEEDFYEVTLEGEERFLLQDDGVIKEFRSKRLPVYVFELTWDKVMLVVNRLSREIGAEAD